MRRNIRTPDHARTIDKAGRARAVGAALAGLGRWLCACLALAGAFAAATAAAVSIFPATAARVTEAR